MAELVVMPKLGLLMETGVVSAWQVSEGDPVAIGAVIAEITTEKITYELESQAEGVLLKIMLPEDEEAPVGAPIAVVGQPGEDISALVGGPPGDTGGAATAGAAVTPGAAAPADAPFVGVTAGPAGPGGRVTASPAAKKLAAELEVDLAAVKGSGPGGRITLEDVGAVAAAAAAGAATAAAFATPVAKKMAAEMGVDLAGVAGGGPSGRIRADDVAGAAAIRPATPAAGSSAAGPVGLGGDPRGGVAQEIPYAGMRRLIGEHMDASRKLAPTVTYQGLADVQELKQLLAWANATRADSDKVNVTAVTIKAAALTLERMPRFNSTIDGDVIKVWRNVNVGVAVALEDGLIVPVIREANRKGLVDIAREVRDLAGRARENRLLPDEITGGTFTVTTLGPYRSVDFFNPIINQPEAAILGVGRMQDTVVAVDGVPAVRATMGLSLTGDHRILDGARAAEFLRTLMDYLAEPFSLAPWPA
jgi:pyruvate dehydrogenase E2 component (dihydrolipoamide acetyltransferase)